MDCLNPFPLSVTARKAAPSSCRLHVAHVPDLSFMQVFWHILTRLSYYRELHVRSTQLAQDGNLSPAETAALLAATGGDAGGRSAQDGPGPGAGASRDGDAGAAAAAQPQVVSEVDTFSARLQSILTSDVTQVGLKRRCLGGLWVTGGWGTLGMWGCGVWVKLRGERGEPGCA